MTDSLFDFLGNCGGFMEALKIVGYFCCFSYNAYVLDTTLANNLVRFVPSKFKKSEQNGMGKGELNKR